MRRIRRYPTSQFEELRRTMLISGNWRAESEKTEILQLVVKLIETPIAQCPQRIPPRKQIWRECAEAKQVIAAVHHHINRQFIASEDLEIGTHVIPQFEPLPFQTAAQLGGFRADPLWHVHQPASGAKAIYLAN